MNTQQTRVLKSKRAHNFKDITGQRFGMFTVIGYSHTDGKIAKWDCLCDCGESRIVPGTALRSGNTKSCGHDRYKNAAEAARKAQTIHGMEGTPEYSSWKAMKERCLRPNHKSYDRYKDIPICDRWLNSFVNFYADMGDRPPGKTLGRIDNEKGYEPGNCRWETPKQQANNRRNSRYVTAFGETLTIAQWSEKLGVRHDTLSFRLKTMPPEAALVSGDMRRSR